METDRSAPAVDREEVERLRKRFMKLDKVRIRDDETTALHKGVKLMRWPRCRSTIRITPEQSTATSFLACHKSPPTLLPHGSWTPECSCGIAPKCGGANIYTCVVRMIAIFDEDGNGDVDFQEFVSGLSAFSSKGNKEQKLRFAFKVYDIDRDGYISNGELFIVLKMMVGSNLKDQQLQQIVDKTIMEADLDNDGKISFEEFTKMVENTDVSMSMTLGKLPVRETAWIELLTFSTADSI